MTTTAPKAILSFLRGAETSRGYEDYYRGSKLAPPRALTTMTVREVREWQRESVRSGSASSAAGGYQIISGTMDTLISEMNLTGDELFDQPMQDQMGTTLLKRRGLDKWAAGGMSDEAFVDNIAQEWASIPRASGPKAGRSHYAGDGLNGATRTVEDAFAALTAGREGRDVDLSGLDASNQRYVGGGSATSGSENGTGRIPLNANYTGADLTDVANTPALSYITQREQDAQQAAIDATTPGLWDGAARAIDEQWVSSSVARMYNAPEFEVDDNFQFNEDLWKEVTAGLPDEYQEALGDATSAAHARSIAQQTRKSLEQDQLLGQMGWTGIGLQIGASLLDPVAILATAATVGSGGVVVYGAKAAKLSRFLRAGAAGAAVNVGVDATLIASDPVGKWSGLAYSAAGGFLLGGVAGSLGRTDMDQELARPLRGFMKEVDTREAGVALALPDGSLSAARVPGQAILTPAEELLERYKSEPMAAFAKARIDMVGVLKKSDNPLLRRVASLLDEDALGNADGSVSLIAANERAVRQIKQTETRFYKTYNSALKEWTKAQGIGLKRLVDPSVRAKFNTEVGLAVRRPLDASKDVNVQRVASQVKAEFAELHRFGREHNIRGFDEFGASDTYLSRAHNIQAIDDLMATRGKGAVNRLVAQALVAGDGKWRAANKAKAQVFKALDYEDALDVAKSYLKSVRSRKYGQLDVNQGMAGLDDDMLRRMLDDEGIAPSRVEEIISRMTASADNGEKGRVGLAKRRLSLDEEFFDPASGMKIEDILENDAEFLFNQYAHSVIRTGYLEDAFSSLKVADADGNLPAHAPSYETIKRYISETNTSDAAMGKAELSLLDTLYNAVKGNPQEVEKAWKNGLQRLRSFNFTRVMNQLGVAQLSELGLILGNGGMKNFITHMPALRKVISQARTGTVADPLMDEIESIWSMGTDVLRHSPSVRMDDGGGSSFMARSEASTGWQKTDFLLNQGKKAVSTLSGMSTINRMLQRFNGRVLVQRFLDHAEGGRQINMKRFAALGIGNDMADQISDQIRKHMGSVDGLIGKRVTHINIDKWDDVDAKNAFINGVDRWSRRTIQENNPGSMPAFMTTEMGKSIFQFRSFMLGSYTKQLLAGAQQRDWETYSSFMASMFFGGLFYVGQTQLNSIGRTDRDEWLEKRLSAEAIAKASFQRAGFSSVLPLVIDTGLASFTDEPIFAYRTSELSTGILGNPTADLINTAGRAIGGTIAAAARSDYDFSQQNFRDVSSLVFLQNAFGIRNIMAAVGGNLPRFSQ